MYVYMYVCVYIYIYIYLFIDLAIYTISIYRSGYITHTCIHLHVPPQAFEAPLGGGPIGPSAPRASAGAGGLP